MGIFRFKHFSVVDDLSAMKVNTDGVLLGAVAPILPSDREVLDIGTGTGTVALMLAQRYAALEPGRGEVLPGGDCPSPGQAGMPQRITGIDIDAPSAREAEANFTASPWSGSLSAVNCDLKDYSPTGKQDLIVSNPPFYDESLKNPDSRLSEARHSVSLSYREILAFAEGHLASGGRLSMVLPSDTEHALMREARSRGLFASSILRVRTTPRKAPLRIVTTFTSVRCSNPEDMVLTIQDGGEYTDEYLALMHDFYLFA